ncbi:MAG: putative toxin-antitoxin system toxin component, PIN family [Micrococcales bacterium]|nr:putative toxin-antitoxin system toxin component, PIN family [Micrococcales bacterium]
MKYLLDTNVLVSAALFPDGTPGRAYDLALSSPHTVVVCDYTIGELRQVFRAKFPGKTEAMELFLSGISPGITVVPTPDTITEVDVRLVRDRGDWPIVRAAVAAQVDAIVSGDRDLLDAELPRPQVWTPARFLAHLQKP